MCEVMGEFLSLIRFSEPDRERLEICLRRLMPHLRSGEYALTGGVAIEAHRARRALPPSRKELADLHFVAASLDTVKPTVAENFLINHFHTPQPGYPKFLVMLVDPISRIRIDIFPDRLGSIEGALRVNGFRLLDAEDLLNHKLDLLSSASPRNLVDRKHFMDAVALADICGYARPDICHDFLGKDEYCQDLSVKCWKCEASLNHQFPLASKAAIFEVLGYV